MNFCNPFLIRLKGRTARKILNAKHSFSGIRKPLDGCASQDWAKRKHARQNDTMKILRTRIETFSNNRFSNQIIDPNFAWNPAREGEASSSTRRRILRYQERVRPSDDALMGFQTLHYDRSYRTANPDEALIGKDPKKIKTATLVSNKDRNINTND